MDAARRASVATTSRQPQGAPASTGGQFAAAVRTEDAVKLMPRKAPTEWVAVEVGNVRLEIENLGDRDDDEGEQQNVIVSSASDPTARLRFTAFARDYDGTEDWGYVEGASAVTQIDPSVDRNTLAQFLRAAAAELDAVDADKNSAKFESAAHDTASLFSTLSTSHIVVDDIDTSVTAMGVVYDSPQAARLRLAKLASEDALLGESDGRVTERNAIVRSLSGSR